MPRTLHRPVIIMQVITLHNFFKFSANLYSFIQGAEWLHCHPALLTQLIKKTELQIPNETITGNKMCLRLRLIMW